MDILLMLAALMYGTDLLDEKPSETETDYVFEELKDTSKRIDPAKVIGAGIVLDNLFDLK